MALLLLLVVAALAVSACKPWETMPSPPGIKEARKETVNRHNYRRADYSLLGLVKDGAAKTHAQYVANRVAYQSGGGCVLKHTSGKKLLAWYNAKAGENIGCIPGCIDAKAAVTAFWNSPDHRAIILDGDFRRIGVGIQCSGNISYFAIHFVA